MNLHIQRLTPLIQAADASTSAAQFNRNARRIAATSDPYVAAMVVGRNWSLISGTWVADGLLQRLINRTYETTGATEGGYKVVFELVASALMDLSEQRAYHKLPRTRTTLYRTAGFRKSTGYFVDRESAIACWTHNSPPLVVQSTSVHSSDLFAAKTVCGRLEIVVYPRSGRTHDSEPLT